MNKMNWRDFFTGLTTGTAIVLLIAVFMIPGMVSNSIKEVLSTTPTVSTDSTAQSTSENSSSENTLKSYETNIQDWTVTTSDGTKLQYHTPEDWYSLADQYNDGLVQYYGKDLPDTGIVCVGDNSDQYKATVIINARPLSNVDEVLATIYADEYASETMLYSDTYAYMKNGTEPENSTIEELDSIVSGDGHTYRMFLHGFDTEYYTNEEQTETEVQHTDEIVGYSDTDDAVEIILYMQNFNKESALSYIKEFLGAVE